MQQFLLGALPRRSVAAGGLATLLDFVFPSCVAATVLYVFAAEVDLLIPPVPNSLR